MQRPLLLALLLIALAAIAVPGWLVASYKPEPQPRIENFFAPDGSMVPAAEVARLERIADNACRCTRSSGDEASCWAAFDKAVTAHPTTNFVSACVPLPSESLCFAGGECIQIDRGSSGRRLCSSAERNAMGAAWNREMAKSEGDSDAERARAFDRANAAMDRVYQRILRGESLADSKGPAGCGG